MSKEEIVRLLNTATYAANQTAKLVTDNAEMLSDKTLASLALFSVEASIETLREISEALKQR